MSVYYDSIGQNYSRLRQPDPRIAAAIERAIGDAETVVNIGAGTGSYEPENRQVVAVEPSSVMIAQRPEHAAPVIQSSAESLPFADDAFDVSLAILTIHHWKDQRKGLREMKRVSKRQVIFTWNPEDSGFWLTQDYFPEILAIDQEIFPRFSAFEEAIGPMRITPVPIPSDCTDGFGCAYWNRPEAYLSENVRNAISTFNRISKTAEGVAALQRDLEDGTWDRKFGDMRTLKALDLGYTLLSSMG